ncbi:MAG TPA: glycosyltransferase family 39 protein [Thermoanaerobaculia bacterium]
MRDSVRGIALLVFLLIVVVVLSIGSVRLDSATSDEPAHIASGVIKVTAGWLGFYNAQPPLMDSLSAVPVVLAGYRMPAGWKGKTNHWAVGKYFLYRTGYDAYRILFLARLPTIVLFAALGIVMYWFVLQETGGRTWALIAAALGGFCPNLMAHGRLVTVDLALTFFTFTATAFLLRFIDRPSSWTAILLGITTAAAALSKASASILGPYFAVVIVAALILRRVEARALWRGLAVAAVAGLLFFEAFMLAEISPAYAREQYPTTPRLLVPFTEYLAMVREIRTWYEHGHDYPQFLVGQFSPSGWPYYYPIAFLLKTTLPAIFLFVAALVVGVRRKSFAFWSLLLFICLFLAVAASGHLALGIRYVLPIYPFIYALTAIALSMANLRRAGTAVVVILLAWHVAENLVAYPSYISYFNESIGSRKNADKFLIDSNLDWGQDLRRLDLWCRKNKVSQIAVHYTGGGFPEYELRSAKPIIRTAPGPDLLPKGYFALSRHLYRISRKFWGVDYDDYLAASHARYVTTIGGSIYVFRIE